ncbi:MAG: MOSC domain-containing protein [Burkholderiales bacterium]|nr:MOSC domain-containing protein [Burkholderiales bacterium]
MIQVAIFTGGIQPLPTSGRPTGMFKTPVAGPVELTVEGFVGDQQADRRVHGGPDKAVHLYPARHYASLAASFPEIAAALVPGALGENLSAADIDERDVRIGDIWQLGTARLQVSQPRSPCWKIDERLACEGVAAWIARNHLTGWYLRVTQAGTVSPGSTSCTRAQAWLGFCLNIPHAMSAFLPRLASCAFSAARHSPSNAATSLPNTSVQGLPPWSDSR